MTAMTAPRIAIGDRIYVRESGTPLCGQYVQSGGARLVREALPGPYRVVDVQDDQVTLIYDLVPEIFETTTADLADVLRDQEDDRNGDS